MESFSYMLELQNTVGTWVGRAGNMHCYMLQQVGTYPGRYLGVVVQLHVPVTCYGRYLGVVLGIHATITYYSRYLVGWFSYILQLHVTVGTWLWRCCYMDNASIG